MNSDFFQIKTKKSLKIIISIAELYIKPIFQLNRMGNFCSDTPYTQLKELYPQDFPKLIQNHFLQKKILKTFDTAMEKLNKQALPIQQQLIDSIVSKSDQIKQHFEKLKDKIEQQYPGGVSLLQMQKNSKIQDFLMYNFSLHQYSTTKKHAQNIFLIQKNKAKAIVQKAKEQQLKNLKDSNPHLQKFQVLSVKIKKEIFSQGRNQYKSLIDKSSEQLCCKLLKNIRIPDLLNNFKRILPVDKLDLLTKVTKFQMSQKVNKLFLKQ